MQRWIKRLRPLACGGIALGIFQAIQSIDFNQLWYEFLSLFLALLVQVLLGGGLEGVSGTEGISLFDSFSF
jgi:hypothetical protein